MPLFDELAIWRLETGSLSRYAILWHKEAKRRSNINWSIAKDLAVRAHLALQKHVGRDLPVQLKLEKRIPAGGGLGGGSSDAAAMLRAINALYQLGLSLEQLASIGATIGSDVPFLVHGGSAIVGGFGDQLSRHERTPQVHAVIAFPEASCPTARVYGLFDEQGAASLRAEQVLGMASNGGVACDAPFNDLAAAAIRAAPELEDHLTGLAKIARRPAHVSGSGSSLFVLCDDATHAESLVAEVEAALGLPAVSVKAVTGS
jgi:4-diphosphocytidyl-2-C-methyl-D-erythritol kinase